MPLGLSQYFALRHSLPFLQFFFFLELNTYIKYSPFNFTKEPFLQYYSHFTYKTLHTLYEIDARLKSSVSISPHIFKFNKGIDHSFSLPFFFFFNWSLLCQDTPIWKNSNQCKSYLAIFSSQPSKGFPLHLEWNPNKTLHDGVSDHHPQVTSHHSVLSPTCHTPVTQASAIPGPWQTHFYLRAFVLPVPSAALLCSLCSNSL